MPGTPAQGTNPDSPSSPPDLVTITTTGCTVSEGASITLEDPDGTQAQFLDDQLDIEIASTSDQITIVGPDNDYIGNHAVSSSDPSFDTAGDYSVVITTGIACEGGNPSQVTPEALIFNADVKRQGGRFVTSVSRRTTGTDSSIVNAGPGAFFLDILVANTNYAVTVEDCGGVTPIEPRGPQRPINDPGASPRNDRRSPP